MTLRVAAAAKRLDVDPKVLRGMAAAGVIPATKIGKGWRFDETLLDEWLRARCLENVKQCPSKNQSARRTTTKSDSGSLGERLDERIKELESPAGAGANVIVHPRMRSVLGRSSTRRR